MTAPAWQRRPKRRATIPPVPAAPESPPINRGEMAEQWAADRARRVALTAGCSTLAEMAEALFRAGDMERETARSLGADV